MGVRLRGVFEGELMKTQGHLGNKGKCRDISDFSPFPQVLYFVKDFIDLKTCL